MSSCLFSGLFCLAPLVPGLAGATEPIVVVDGQYDEWAALSPVHIDPSGDGSPVDFLRLWVASNSEVVTFRFEVGSEINLQNSNAITIYIDGDGNRDTGCDREHLGAELVWTFGERGGLHCRKGASAGVSHSAVGLEMAPTVSSAEFEVSFRRYREDGSPLLPGPTASVVIRDLCGESGDRLPDGEEVLDVELSDHAPPTPRPTSIERLDPDDLRILTWNVRFDGLFRRPASFLRILKAIDPDIICFQEVWSHTSQQSADQLALALPDSDWYGASAVEGHIVSRYPFRSEASIDAAGNYWAWIDLPDDRYGADLSIINAHPPCCEKERRRQEQLDGIAAWVRDLASSGEVPKGTPTVLAGDMNLVGRASQLQTVLAGKIVDEETYGPSFFPDWDQTPLADADPRRTNGFSNTTWRNRKGTYSPGKLDYVLYSDSVMRLRNSFILETAGMPHEILARHGLRPEDTEKASDHLPVVADFTLVAGQAETAGGE